MEQLSNGNADLWSIRYGVAGGRLPPGLDPNAVYGFAAMAPGDRQAFMDEGRRLVAAERRARNIPAPGAAQAGLGPIAQPVAVAPATSGCHRSPQCAS